MEDHRGRSVEDLVHGPTKAALLSGRKKRPAKGLEVSVQRTVMSQCYQQLQSGCLYLHYKAQGRFELV
jgi:hypothetical protein